MEVQSKLCAKVNGMPKKLTLLLHLKRMSYYWYFLEYKLLNLSIIS